MTGASEKQNTLWDFYESQLKPLLKASLLLSPAGLLLVLFLVLPTVFILQISLVPGLRPGQAIEGYGLSNYTQILESVYLGVLWRSFRYALVTTIICLVAGFPVAYWLALMSPKHWRNVLLVGFIFWSWIYSSYYHHFHFHP